MKTQYKKFTSRLSQAGSLMVEAMAMLALISLVTPTLYKKSAERTTELQDINTATHVRTVMKAVDNYAAANYQELIKDLADGSVKKINIDDETYASFFPYGYKFDNLKNFGKPKVALRRQGNSITSFVEFPQSLDIGEMRAARIASMVGSNGGYVDGEGKAKGVGGIWNLNNSDLSTLGFSGGKGSVVVASSDAINSANSAALENEKYLQRTKVESEDQKWRNAMTTNLYMGGVTGADDMYKILGVDQMIIGSTDFNTNKEDLVITADSGDGGSAWLAGSLSAVSGAFTVNGDDANPVMTLASGESDILYADSNHVELLGGDAVGLTLAKDTLEMITDYDTTIENNLHVSGNAEVATGDTTTSFKAGPDGSYITADVNSVNMLNGLVDVNKGGEGGNSLMSVKTQKVNIDGDTKMGTGDAAPVRADLNPKLNVQGNAFVSNILEAGELDTKQFKALELHAGGENFDDGQQWLNATSTGVKINNPKLAGENTILDIDATTAALFGPHGNQGGVGSGVIMGDGNAQMRGEEYAALYTTQADGYITLQNGAMVLTGTQNGDPDNRIDINAATTTVNEGVFQVQGTTPGSDGTDVTNSSLYVDPINGGRVEIAAKNTNILSNRTMVKPVGDEGSFEIVRNSNDQKILSVVPEGLSSNIGATLELDSEQFSLSDLDDNKKIVEINADYGINPTAEFDEEKQGSIYIRRGAIQVEKSSGDGYGANQGYGYVEASRFISNAEYNGIRDIPKKADDKLNSFTGEPYDYYMVNPTYTSVMHDIKLTTRGGARLSDILPDFINKGIYVVNNTYQDNIDINQIQPNIVSNRVVALNASEVFDDGTNLSGVRKWASPFLGIVPAPQCPPGYARVITITPAGFMMSQAGRIIKEDAYDYQSSGVTKRFAVDVGHTTANDIGNVNVGSTETITGASLNREEITDQAGADHTIYYLGHAVEPGATDASGEPYSPDPLYFQQSTWLKSKVDPVKLDHKGPCNTSLGSGEGCGDGFVGWSTIMGFIYPSEYYKDIIQKVAGGSPTGYYWNIFPVMAQTLEAYATVYCYFDRTNLYKSGQNPIYVDPYDQLNNFRKGYEKSQPGVNTDYLDRLNDPSLKYKEPW